jgi:uncharacterized membrane protein YraQ (UPF0718 family)
MTDNKKENPGKKKKRPKQKLILPAIVLILYIVLAFVNPGNILEATGYSLKILISVLPILLLVLLFMFLFNLIDEKKLKKVIENSPQFIQYMVMTFLGTFSHGPIYAWYPLMKEFHDKGISYGSVASFLYARGIKLTLMPILVSYFGLKFTIILTVYMLVFSYIQGILVDLLVDKKAALPR